MSYPSYPGPSEPSGQPQPPQQPPYGAPQQYYPVAPAPTPVGGLGTAAICVAVLLTVYEVVEAALAWLARPEYLEAARNGQDALDVLTPYDLLGIVALPVLIAAFVVTSIWLFRARTNVGIVRPGLRHQRAAGWAWGGWVTPVVSLWFPFQVVRDTARTEGGRSLVPFLGAWWTVWLVALISGQIGPRLTLAGPVGEGEAQFLGPIETFNAVFVVVALVLWVKIVRAVNADQEGMFRAGPARPLTA